MKRLRIPRRLDTLTNDKRVTRPVLGKWLYLMSLLALFMWLGNLFFGGYVYFRADGLAVREAFQVGAHYAGTIEDLMVAEGDYIEAGAGVARVNSIDIIREQTALTVRLSELAAKRATLQSRAAVLQSLIPAAKRRAVTTRELVDKAREAYRKGLGTNQNLSRLLEDDFDSEREATELVGEAGATREERRILENIIADIQGSLDNLKAAYKGGHITAPASGIVTDFEVREGSVVTKGDGLMVVLAPPDYILAYLDPNALHTVGMNDKVTVSYGPNRLSGTVTRIYPLSAVLPLEFQKAFRPKERSQMLRIDFVPGETPPPLFTKVRVRAPGMIPNWLFGLF